MIHTTVGKYKITRLLGEGGMASVYEAVHVMLGTKVAVKVLNPILSANHQIRERFRNEAIMMASLDHPNITKVIDFDEQPQQLSIIMEFLQGEDLNEKIKRSGPLSDKEIGDVFSQTLTAFQYAHEKGIVHRDIKPSNIFILPNGHVKILDFGIAKLFGQGNEMTQTGTQIGTPIYMSPEQVKADKSIDHRSDIYSLGVTMFFAINGKPPYNVDTDSQFDIFSKIVYETLPVFSLSSLFSGLVMKACNKNREERYQSCKEWLSDLNRGDSNSKDKTVVNQTAIEKTSFDSKKNLSAKQQTPPMDLGDLMASNRKREQRKNIILAILGFLFTVAIVCVIALYASDNGTDKADYTRIYEVNRNVKEDDDSRLTLKSIEVNDSCTVLKFDYWTSDTSTGIAIHDRAYILDKYNLSKLYLLEARYINYTPDYSYTPYFELVFPLVSTNCESIDFIEDEVNVNLVSTWKTYDIKLSDN